MLAILCQFFILNLVVGQPQVSQPTQTFVLDPRVTFKYTLKDQTFVEFELTCKTLGWCAIGFGSNYPNADIIRLSSINYTIKIEDMTAKPNAYYLPPQLDAQQDVTLNSGWQNTTHTYGRFTRKLITDDFTDFSIPLMRQTPMIWALSDGNVTTREYIYGYFNVMFGFNDTYNCHYQCSQCLGPLESDCLQCAVAGVQPLNGYCSISDLDELDASMEIISGDYTVYWGYPLDGYIDLLFTVTLCDWFGMGFGENMYGTDMLLFKVNQVNSTKNFQTITNYVVEVHDMWAYGNFIPDDDFMRGGTQNWQLLGYNYDSSQNNINVKVRRLLNTGDPNDYILTKQDMKVAYAYGKNTSQRIIYHKANRGVVLLQLSQTDTRDLLSDWGDFVYRGHTILMFVFWGVISDIGIFFARQLKSYPKYAKVHGMLFLFQSIITYIFVLSMINLHKDRIQQIDSQRDIVIAHFSIGIVVLVVMTVQLFFGLMVKNNLESLNGSDRVYRLKGIHQIFGYFLYIFTKINVAIGMEIYQQDLLFWFYSWYILLGLIKVTIEMLYLFEVSMFSRKRITYHYVETDKNFLYERLIDRLNQGAPRSELLREFPKLRYVILREAIYDVSDFNHPGGQFIHEAIKGREIGRYFYGGSPVDQMDILPHIHTAFAINYIETRYIGDLRNECCPILYHNEKQVVNSKKSDRQIWKFKESRKVSNSCSLFIFQTNYFSVRQQLKGVQWFGRYFYIKPYGSGYLLQERPYSVIMCLSDENIHLRQQMIDYFKEKVIYNNNEQYHQPYIENVQFSNTLCFLIKKYSFSQNMSKFIHDTQHKPYEVTGPYGLGLELNENSNGVHYIFCNGTGILPFLDLLDYLLKKALYTILYDRCGHQEADYINPMKEDYLNNFGSDFRVVLVGSFKNKNEFHGYPIVQDLYFICRNFDLKYFDMIIRLSDPSDKLQNQDEMNIVADKFDLDFIKKTIKYNPTKVYVCGDPTFQEDMLVHMKTIGVNKRNIIIV